MSLAGQCFILTGAAGNLGSALWAELAAKGCRIAAVDRTHGSLQTMQESISGAENTLLLPGIDLTNPDDAQRMAAETVKHFGQIDGLVNTIGTFSMAPIAENALSGWAQLMDLNAKTVLVSSAAVLPYMVARRYGRIVHIAAGAGLKGTAGLGVYSASKAAVIRIIESIAAEHRADGITANCILPATIDTPQNRKANPQSDHSDWVKPAAIARSIALLLSPEAAVITGASIPATGLG